MNALPAVSSRFALSERRESRRPITWRTPSGIPNSSMLVAFARPGAVLPVERAGVDEVEERLANEERVAVRLAADRVDKRGGRFLFADHGEQLAHFARVQPFQQYSLVLRFAAELGQRLRERVLAVELDVAVRPDDQQSLLSGEARDVPEHRDRSLVCPVQIVEEQHDRRALRMAMRNCETASSRRKRSSSGWSGAGSSMSGSASLSAGTSRAMADAP